MAPPHRRLCGGRRVVKRCYMANPWSSSTDAALTRLSVHRGRAPQPCLAVAQRREIELSLGGCFLGASKDAVEQRAVEGDQQQIDAGIERFDHRRADIVLI